MVLATKEMVALIKDIKKSNHICFDVTAARNADSDTSEDGGDENAESISDKRETSYPLIFISTLLQVKIPLTPSRNVEVQLFTKMPVLQVSLQYASSH